MAWMMAERVLEGKLEEKGRNVTGDGRVRTLACRVLSEVLGLVSAQETDRVLRRSSTPRQLLVEIDYPLHANSIGICSDSLCRPPSATSPARQCPGHDDSLSVQPGEYQKVIRHGPDTTRLRQLTLGLATCMGFGSAKISGPEGSGGQSHLGGDER
jgi:hypothetical protein